jgi:hypothetical protein
MANRGDNNISGMIPDLKQDVENLAANHPLMPASGRTLVPDVDSLKDKLTKQNYDAANKSLRDFNSNLSNSQRLEDKLHRDRRIAGDNELRNYDSLNRSLMEEIRQLKELQRWTKVRKDLSEDQRDLDVRSFQTQINSKRVLQNLTRQEIVNSRYSIQVQEQAHRKRLDSYDDIRYKAQQTQRVLEKMEDTRYATLRHSIGRNLSVRRGLEDYGRNRVSASLSPSLGGTGTALAEGGGLASIGGIAGGLFAMVAAKVLKFVGEKLVENFKRNLQSMVVQGDVAKTGSAYGQGLYSFRSELHGATDGLGVSLEEEGSLAGGLRKRIGQQQRGGMGNALRTGILLDRSMGMDLGTGGDFVGSMLRGTQLNSGSAEMNRFALQIADAIGRGRLVGLQEEMLDGIKQLVEVDRRAAPGGVNNPAMFADIIAGVSSLRYPNLRGGDVANVFGNISESIKNPTTTYGNVNTFQALREVMTEKGMGGQADLASLMVLKSQGLSMEAGGKNIGIDVVRRRLELIKKQVGSDKDPGRKNLAALVAAGALGIDPAVAKILLENGDKIFGNANNSVASMFGLKMDDQTMANVGNMRFLSILAETMQAEGGSGKEAVVNKSAKAFMNTMNNSSDKDKIRDAMGKGGGADEMVRNILSAGAQISSANSGDDWRRATINMDKTLQKLTDYALPFFATVAGWFNRGTEAGQRMFQRGTDEMESMALQDQLERDAARVRPSAENKIGTIETNKIYNEAGNKLEAAGLDRIFAETALTEHGSSNFRNMFGNIETVRDPRNPKSGRKLHNVGLFNYNVEGKQAKNFLDYAYSRSPKAVKEKMDKFFSQAGYFQDSSYEKGTEKYNLLQQILEETAGLQETYFVENYVKPAQESVRKAGGDANSLALVGTATAMRRIGVRGLDKKIKAALGASGNNPEQAALALLPGYESYLKDLPWYNEKSARATVSNMRRGLGLDDLAVNPQSMDTPMPSSAIAGTSGGGQHTPYSMQFMATINQNTQTNGMLSDVASTTFRSGSVPLDRNTIKVAQPTLTGSEDKLRYGSNHR